MGGVGCSKLIVSVSLGSSAVFRWRRRSCPDSDVNSCYLCHGDILVMDGQCQDEFLHRTDPGLEQERINDTFQLDQAAYYFLPIAGSGSMLPANVCAGFVCYCFGELGVSTFWVLWGSLGSCVCVWGLLVLLVLSLLFTGLGLGRCVVVLST